MKAYLITSGEYSSYMVENVTLDKEKAEKLTAYLNSRDKWSDYRIEEYEIDDFEVSSDIEVAYQYAYYTPARNKNLRDHAFLSLILKGTNKTHMECDNKGAMIVVVLPEEDEKKAFKIATDMFAEYKAEWMK